MVRVHLELPGEERFNGFLTEFQHETERAAAVLGAAYLDTLLEELLCASFVEAPTDNDRLFAQEGPLASFSARIKLAYFLGLITKEEHDDLHQVREIRNRFAHKIHGLTFDTDEIRDRCRNLKCTEERFKAVQDLNEGYPRDARSLFDLGVALLAFYLMRRIENAARPAKAKPPLWLPSMYDNQDERR